MRQNTIFKGMATAMVTPMTAAGVDYEARSGGGGHHRRERDSEPRRAQ